MAERKKPVLIRADQVEKDGSARQPTTVNANDLKQGERRLDVLPPDLKARADLLFDRVGKIFFATRDEWYDGFCRDQTPEREIAVWERISAVADDLWSSQPQALRGLDRTSVLRAVIMVSSGVVDVPAQVQGITDEGVVLIRAAYVGA